MMQASHDAGVLHRLRIGPLQLVASVLKAFVITSGIALGVAGCSALPGVGPQASAVAEAANQPVDAQQFVVVDINNTVLDVLAHRPHDASLVGFGNRSGPFEPTIGVGDAVSVSIWEAAAGGLFSSTAASLPVAGGGAHPATIPEQVVGRDGRITIPFAGSIQTLGRRPSEVQKAIERALAGKTVQPQVIVSVTRSASSNVTVFGEGAQGARVPLSPRGDRVLDVLATAGGLRTTVNESVVQLTRGGSSVRVPLSRLTADPVENIFVRPGDVITVLRDPQMFFAYGATGRNADVPFDTATLSLTHALSKAGGLLDFRSDPEGVFIYRLEPTKFASQFATISPMAQTGRYTKVIYRVNMRDPNAIFLASQFRIFHRDVVYVSNAPLTELQKVLQLFNMIASPAAQGVTLAGRVN